MGMAELAPTFLASYLPGKHSCQPLAQSIFHRHVKTLDLPILRSDKTLDFLDEHGGACSDLGKHSCDPLLPSSDPEVLLEVKSFHRHVQISAV